MHQFCIITKNVWYFFATVCVISLLNCTLLLTGLQLIHIGAAAMF